MRLPSIDMISFWIGAAAATVIWWVIALSRPLIKQIFAGIIEANKERQLQASAGVEGVYRKMVYKQTQPLHLAASLFSLDEIAQPVRLLAPPPFAQPGSPPVRLDTAEEGLPYMPTWPEIASVYRAPTLTIPQALSGGMNLILVGQPGAGKTVALAHLASQIVNHAPEVESLHENIPILVHIADLGLPLANMQTPKDLLAPIINLMVEHSPVFDARRMPDFVDYAFQSGRALFLLDGVDELPQAAILEVAAYLRPLLKAYPKIQVITTAGQEYANGLASLSFEPLAIMPWNATQQKQFVEHWSALWQRHVATEPWAKNTAYVDAILLNRWLTSDNFGLTPLELTLKIWGAYAGDARGPRPVDAIDAHLRRLLPVNAPVEALHILGAQASLKGASIFENKNAKEWIKSFEPAEPTAAEVAASEAALLETDGASGQEAPEPAKSGKKTSKKGGAQPAAAPRTGLIGQLTNSGILSAHTGNHLRFTHPIFMGYLAGKSLNHANDAEALLRQPAWSGQVMAMRYIAAFNDASVLVNGLLAMDDPILQRPSLTAARLLREAPRNASWRMPLMSKLVELLQNEDLPMGLRGQVIAAFAVSGDPSTASLFRQLMMAPSSELRRLGAIGAGVLADGKAVEALSAILNQSTGAVRDAACLALVQIATPAALEAVATALLRGDEPLRIAAAEALANHPEEGHDALREGVTNQDILLRRAAVYGLARINEPWSIELLEKAQVEDEQWAVRSAAVEIVERREKPDGHIQQRLKAPSDTAWLIEFAGKHGQGITPGAAATDILLTAFKDDNPEIRAAALNYLRYTPTEGVLAELYQKFFGTDSEVKEEVYRALAEIAYNGTPLPPPMQFGLG